MTDPDSIIDAHRQWLREVAEGGRAAETATVRACAGCGEALAVLTENLRGIGYPCLDTVEPCSTDLELRLQDIERKIGSRVPQVLKTFWRTLGGISLVDLRAYEHVRFWERENIASAVPGARPPVF